MIRQNTLLELGIIISFYHCLRCYIFIFIFLPSLFIHMERERWHYLSCFNNIDNGHFCILSLLSFRGFPWYVTSCDGNISVDGLSSQCWESKTKGINHMQRVCIPRFLVGLRKLSL